MYLFGLDVPLIELIFVITLILLIVLIMFWIVFKKQQKEDAKVLGVLTKLEKEEIEMLRELGDLPGKFKKQQKSTSRLLGKLAKLEEYEIEMLEELTLTPKEKHFLAQIKAVKGTQARKEYIDKKIKRDKASAEIVKSILIKFFAEPRTKKVLKKNNLAKKKKLKK